MVRKMVGKNVEFASNVSVDDDDDRESDLNTTLFSGGNGLEPLARSSNALWKRAEQLKRWEDSETNRENPNRLRGGIPISWSPFGGYGGRVKFSDECVFFAACVSGDIDEVERLLERGADINTTNVDGMTALHQAVIEENLDFVQFLVENGADVDAQDNEGWTPLMAGVSCEFMDIVRYLLDKGADPAAVNSDGELALDLTDSPEVRSLLQQEISRRGIDLEEARRKEENAMMKDALEMLNSHSLKREKEKRHPRTGATPLHVAAAKGYIKVMNILLQAGADVNAVDFEGWTPLHAAAHWNEQQACEILVEHLANMDMENNAKQTCFQVADTDELCEALQEMKKRQEQMKKERKPFDPVIEQNSTSRQLQEYKVRKNSITRISTDMKKNLTKTDEMKEAKVLRTASSSSEASDDDKDENKAIMRSDKLIAETSTARTPLGPAQPAVGAASLSAPERKRQEIVQPTLGPPKLARLDSEGKLTTGSTTTATTTVNTTTTASSPLASVSVTVVQPARSRQTISVDSSNTTSSTIPDELKSITKLDEWKIAQPAGKPTRGPPIIVPSEPPPPPWRMSGRRGNAASADFESPTLNAKTNSSQPTNVVSVQVTSTTAPTPSRVAMVSAASLSPTADGVKWRQTRFDKQPILDEAEKSSSKLPWLRSSNPPAATPSPWSHLMSKKSTGSITPSPVMYPPPSNDNKNPCTRRSQPFSPPPFLHPKFVRPISIEAQEQPIMKPAGSTSVLRHAVSDAATTSSSHRPFTPPQRSEESEAERKARAKKERESRRSTQGVTLEAVKMAEQVYGTSSSDEAAKRETVSSVEHKSKTKSDSSSGTESNHIAKTTIPAAKDVETSKPASTTVVTKRLSSMDVGSKTVASVSTPSALYPWRTTGRLPGNDGGSDIVKSDGTISASEKPGTGSVIASSPFAKRLQGYARNDQNTASAGDKKDTSSSSQLATSTQSTTTSAVAASPGTSPPTVSATANIPNRKRIRNTRRSTGPVAQEDVQLALETDQEGQMTTDDDNNALGTRMHGANVSGGGDQKVSNATTSQQSAKTNAAPTVLPVGGTGIISPITDRKNAVISGSSREQQTNIVNARTSRYPLSKADTVPSTRTSTVNGAAGSTSETDYKKLYEREKAENERLLEKIKYLESLIESTRMIGSNKQQHQTGSGDPGQQLNDRERRTLEKRIAQLEEETKVVEQLRADNQRLKEENGALIRVISKLSK